MNTIGLAERNRLPVTAGGLRQALQQQGSVAGSVAAATS
jgi:hypothetical protein